MSARTYPYTSDDLRYIADRIDEVLNGIHPVDQDLKENDWRRGLTVDIFDDANHPVGQIRPEGDGWLGFYLKEIK